MARFATALLALAALAGTPSTAFVAPNMMKGRVSTEVYGNTKQPPALPPLKDISYGEESRQYRRTVYTHDDWVKHRDPNRFWRNLLAITTSGVYKNIGREVLATTSVATFVCLYNMVVGGYDNLNGEHMDAVINSPFLPMLALPLTAFTLTSPSLGLLLVFRTNTSYQRWDEARKNWGMNINHTRDLVRMANAYYDREGVSEEQQKKDLQAVSLATWSFVRSMKRHLSPESEDEENFKKELFERLPKEQAESIINAAHRPNRALFDLSMAIENLPMHFLRKNEIQRAVTIFEDNLGSSERLLTSPVPLFYSRHTARFLSFWLLLMPFALYDPFKASWNHIGMIPATAAISVFLFGIEELATQLEEPFTILPMQAFCDKIGNWCNEIVSWSPGDNGMPVQQAKPQHTQIAMNNGVAVPAEKPAAAVTAKDIKVAPTEVPISNGEAIAAAEASAVVAATAMPRAGAVAAPEAPAVVEAPKETISEPVTAKAPAPKAEAPKAEAPEAEVPKVEAPKVEAPKAEAPKAEAVIEAPKPKPVDPSVYTQPVTAARTPEPTPKKRGLLGKLVGKK